MTAEEARGKLEISIGKFSGDERGDATEVMRAIDAFEHAVREEALNFCHDCGCEVASGPVLCEGCVSVRNSEGMDTEDSRTIDEWRKT